MRMRNQACNISPRTTTLDHFNVGTIMTTEAAAPAAVRAAVRIETIDSVKAEKAELMKRHRRLLDDYNYLDRNNKRLKERLEEYERKERKRKREDDDIRRKKKEKEEMEDKIQKEMELAQMKARLEEEARLQTRDDWRLRRKKRKLEEEED